MDKLKKLNLLLNRKPKDTLKDIVSEKSRDNYVTKTPEDTYEEVANKTPLSAEEISGIGGFESHHGVLNKPIGGGSARGLFHIQPETAE